MRPGGWRFWPHLIGLRQRKRRRREQGCKRDGRKAPGPQPVLTEFHGKSPLLSASCETTGTRLCQGELLRTIIAIDCSSNPRRCRAHVIITKPEIRLSFR